jgi:uncharacterized HhH-GPD family protein
MWLLPSFVTIDRPDVTGCVDGDHERSHTASCSIPDTTTVATAPTRTMEEPMTKPDALYFTEDGAANAFLAAEPAALLVGIVLYQQVPTEKAFAGPLVLQERLGRHLDIGAIAAMDPDELERLFRDKPALHRFPASMAKKVQAVAQHVVDEHGGEVSRLWEGAASAAEVLDRIQAMPGFGEYKARVYFGVLAARFGVRPDGWQAVMPDWPSIADITRPEDLPDLKLRKKAWKESQ